MKCSLSAMKFSSIEERLANGIILTSKSGNFHSSSLLPSPFADLFVKISSICKALNIISLVSILDGFFFFTTFKSRISSARNEKLRQNFLENFDSYVTGIYNL